jgi:hypothetical protein
MQLWSHPLTPLLLDPLIPRSTWSSRVRNRNPNHAAYCFGQFTFWSARIHLASADATTASKPGVVTHGGHTIPDTRRHPFELMTSNACHTISQWLSSQLQLAIGSVADMVNLCVWGCQSPGHTRPQWMQRKPLPAVGTSNVAASGAATGGVVIIMRVSFLS